MASRAPFNAKAKPPVVTTTQRSPWHSPVPYLFGGLAAMLGLIAFSLLILACSYWKLSGYLDGGDGDRDLEAGEGNGDDEKKMPPVFEEKILVIMAGQAKPTFLATPVSSRTSSFGDSSSNNGSCVCHNSEKSVAMTVPEKRHGINGGDSVSASDDHREQSENRETSEQRQQTH